MMNFLKRIFRIFARGEEPVLLPPTKTVESVKPVQPAPRSVLVSWVEMIDRHSRIAGYRLPSTAVHAGATIGGPLLLQALEGENVKRLAERRLVIIPLTVAQWRAADFAPLVAPHTCFQVGAAGGFLATGDWLELAREIRGLGARVAVDGAGFARLDGGVDLVDVLVLDGFGIELAAFEARVKALRQQYPSLVVAVDGVGSWDEFRFFASLGIDYCLGSFAASPDISEQSDRMGQGRLVVVEMLNLLRGDADLVKVATTAKRDPAVVLKLLEMANSPLSGLSRRVSNIEDAIMLLGREAVYRWLALAMFRIDSKGGRDETLLVIALSRASCLEALAPNGDKKMAGELFLVGMLSVVDSLLGQPMAVVLEKMHLPDAVSAALLRSEGTYARYLLLTTALERCRIEEAISLAGGLGIDPGHLLACYSKAMAWATSDLIE